MPSPHISNSESAQVPGFLPEPAVARIAQTVGRLIRAVQDLARYRSFFWLVVLPMTLVCAYLWLGASDRFVSESRVAVKQAEGVEAGGLNVGMLAIGGSRSTEDMHFLEQHIQSADMVEALDRELLLRDKWANSPDWFGRLDIDATREEFLAYYRKRVHVSADSITGILTLETEAFTPRDARDINFAILRAADRFINELSNRIAREQVLFIEAELEESRQRVELAHQRILQYQNEHQVLDPAKQAEMKARLAAELETRLSEVQAELTSSLSYLQPNAAPVLALKSRVQALKKQIQQEKSAISGEGQQKLNQIAADYQTLHTSAQFATDLYKTTLAALERARVDATMKLKSLALIVTPHLPEEAERPRRAYLTGTWMLGLVTLFGLIRLVTATIQDHRE